LKPSLCFDAGFSGLRKLELGLVRSYSVSVWFGVGGLNFWLRFTLGDKALISLGSMILSNYLTVDFPALLAIFSPSFSSSVLISGMSFN